MPYQNTKRGKVWTVSFERIRTLRVATSNYMSSCQQYPLNFWLCSLLLFLVELGCAILGAPSPKLLEAAVCRQHFEQESRPRSEEPPDAFCRNKEVQVHFAFVMTVLSTLSTLAATIIQIPMGTIADKGGRRLALTLNITSIIFYWGSVAVVGFVRDLPIWGFYIAPFFVLLGGGPWATGTLVFAAISDSVKPEQRTNAFSILEALSSIADLLGPILSAVTMTLHIGIPFALGLVVFFTMFIPASCLTEDKLEVVEYVTSSPAEIESLFSAGDALDGERIDPVHSFRRPSPSRTAIFTTCFVCFFLFQVARDCTSYLVPWVSLRFGETMARAGLLFSLRAIVSFILFFGILPLGTLWLDKTWQTVNRDLVLSAASTACSVVGTLIMSLAPNTTTVAIGFSLSILGSSMTITLRSFLASNVQTTFSGRLFAGISTIGTVGSLIGMPIMGYAYSLGVNHDIGFPFLVAAASYSCAIGLLLWLAMKV